MIFRPEFENKLQAYNEYFASDSKQQITVKNVSTLFLLCSTHEYRITN